jgi:carbamoyltransferase
MDTSRKRRYVLGVNTGPHDASAALLRDGELVAMLEQERFSRNKHAFSESPGGAITACLAHEGIDIGAVAEIAVGWDVPSLMEIESSSFNEREFTSWLLGAAGTSAQHTPPIRYVNHHLAHAASAFYTSGKSKAAILVVDGRGEAVATTIANGGPSGIEVVRAWGTHLSLGHLYGWAAEWAGMSMWGTGKLMGLAAYGNACQPTPMQVVPDGYLITDAPPAESSVPHHFVQLRSRLRNSFRTKNYPFGPGQPSDVMAHADFAASIQGGLESVLLALATMARRETGQDTLVLAGGVALNCTANGSLIRSRIFDDVWIPPFPHDAGVSIGAAFIAHLAANHSGPTPSRLRHAFWAPAIEISDREASEQLAGYETNRYNDAKLHEMVAQHLEEGRLVGWWQGRGEVGQRALGARSILCDPRKREMLVRANLVKGREVWRPLAPAVLAEHTHRLFDDPLTAASDFMLAAWPVREAARSLIPAAVHVDGSARPQVVRQDQSRYNGVINAFHDRTGVPAVINTSFNLAGEPIVLSARDAISTFLRSDLDVLVVGDLIAVKPLSKTRGAGAAKQRLESLKFTPWNGDSH